MRRLLLGIAATAMASVGCGGDDDDRLSSADFEEQGNAICLRYREAIADALADLGPGRPSAEDAQRVMIETVVPEQQTQLEGLRELTPPEEISSEYEAFLDETEDAVETLEDWAQNDPERLLEDDPFPEFDDRAADLGLASCGSS